MQAKCRTMAGYRSHLLTSLAELGKTGLGVGNSIGGNDANFVMIPILDSKTGEPSSARANKVYKALAEEHGVVVRYRGNEPGCSGCLRITVGTEEENKAVLDKLTEVLRIIS